MLYVPKQEKIHNVRPFYMTLSRMQDSQAYIHWLYESSTMSVGSKLKVGA